ncbi:MAG TPA: HEPN domain-containing protein [Candidatus Hypogeohydataceae bacterium YC38]|jgi:HEPN domain-containing protein|nr:HEPN domain-containing protein [Candidatus Brocadiales bacterium]
MFGRTKVTPKPVDKDVQYWLNLARYDMDTAVSMYKAKRYLYVLFSCQQAVERMLNALVVKSKGEFPPGTHDLLHLAELAQLELKREDKEFLGMLSFYYVHSRYSQDTSEATKNIARDCLEKTRGVLKCLEQKIH